MIIQITIFSLYWYQISILSSVLYFKLVLIAKWLSSHYSVHRFDLIVFFTILFDPSHLWFWLISIDFFTHFKDIIWLLILESIGSFDYSFWMSRGHTVVELSHWSTHTKTQKQVYFKLPSIFDLQPQRVSWSDNKLAPLPGRGDWSSTFLGDDTEMIFDGRQRLDITLVVIISSNSISSSWLQRRLVPGRIHKNHLSHQCPTLN